MITRRLTMHYRSKLDRPVSWVALVGFMGSGKSRIGAELSRKLHLNFIDTDKVIERVSCMQIPDIFELYGETTFRDYESEIIRRSCRLDDAIISTGGGTVVRPKNREALKKRGPVVLLTASAETTFQRTRRHKRPLLEVGNPIERINDLMAARKGFYEDVASFTVSTDNRPSFEVVDEIIEKLYEWQNGQDELEMLHDVAQQVPDNFSSTTGTTTNQALKNQAALDSEILGSEILDSEIHSKNLQIHSETTVYNAEQRQHVMRQEISYQQVVKIQTRRLPVEEHSLDNNEPSETQFSDDYMTEVTEAPFEEQQFEDGLRHNCLENEVESSGTGQHSSQHSDANVGSVNSVNDNSSDRAKEVQEEEPEELEESRDIYAEMIRDLMRDPRA